MDRIIRIKVDANQAKKEVDVLDDKMTGLGTKINGVAAAIAAAFATGVVAKFLNDSVNAARNFEASLSNLSAITGAVGKDLEFLRQTALEFGATTTLSASQAAEALKLVASAKPELLESGTALKEVTRQAILLAEAAGIDLAAAANTVGSSLNQFSAEADQAARFVNVLAAGAKFGSSEITDTTEALKNAGVSAAGAGVSFEETNASIQALAKDAIKGAEAGTSLRNVLLILQTSNDKLLKPSINGVSGALENLSKMQLNEVELVKLFGRENYNAALSLIKNRDLIKDLTGQLTGTNTAFEQASKNTDNLNGDLKGLFSALEAVQIQIGSKFTGTLREFTQETTSLLQAVNGNEEALKEWGDTFQIVYNVALLVSAVIAGKLVNATVLAARQLLITAAAALSAKVQYDSMGLAISRTTVAANIGSVAMRGLSATVATLGGPLGVVLLAASALIAFTGAASETKFAVSDLDEEVARLAESYSKLSAGALGSQYIQAQEEAARVDQQLAEKKKDLEQATQKAISGFKSIGSQVAELKENTAKLNAEIAELEQRKSGLAVKIHAVTTAFENGLPAVSQYKDELTGTAVAVEETAKNLALTFDQIKQTSSDLDSLFSGGINLFNGSDSTGQNEESTNRINERIAPSVRSDGSSIADSLDTENQLIDSALALRVEAYRTYGATIYDINVGEFERQRALLELSIVEQTNAATLAEQSEIARIEARRQQIFENESLSAAERIEINRLLDEQLLLQEQTTQQSLTQINAEGAASRKQLAEAERQTRLMQLGQLGDSLMSLGQGQSKKVFEIGKKLAIAQAAIALPTAVMESFKNGGGYPWGLVPAATMAATGLKNIQKIRSTTYGGGGGTASLGSGGGGGAGLSGGSSTLPTQPQGAQTVQTLEIRGLDEIRDELRNQDGMVSTRFVATILDKISDANRIRGEG